MKDAKILKKLGLLVARINDTMTLDNERGHSAGGSVSMRLSQCHYERDVDNVVIMIGVLKSTSANKYLYEYANLLWRYYDPSKSWKNIPSRDQIREAKDKIVFK